MRPKMLRDFRSVVLPLLCWLPFAGGIDSPANAEDWPTWRGPNLLGISSETDLPTEWSRDKNVAWKVPLPGPAGASPVVWGDHIFLTSVEDKDLVLMAISTAGKPLWKQTVTRGNRSVRGDEGNFASPSPVTDGEHVFAAFGNGIVVAYDFAGKELWRVDLQKRYGKFRIAFGWSSSPVLHGDRLCLQVVHGDGKAETREAYVVALDKTSGEELWKSERVTGAYNENEHSYASPVVYPFGEKPYLITHGSDYAIAYRFEDGQELWRLGGLNPQNDNRRPYHRTLRFVASPAVGPDTVVVPTAKNGPVFAIRPTGSGDVTENKAVLKWSLSSGTPDVPTPLVHDGIVYLCRENGNLMALRAENGEQIYLERTHRTRHRASPVYADGHIYLTARDGKVTVIKAGPDFEIVAQNDLNEELSASPAISGGRIYLRTFDHLWAIEAK